MIFQNSQTYSEGSRNFQLPLIALPSMWQAIYLKCGNILLQNGLLMKILKEILMES